MKKIFIFIFLLSFNSCIIFPDEDVEVRILNKTGNRIYGAIINDVQYGTIENNSYSEYKEHDVIYRYGYVKVQIDTTEYTIQPIDYVGEKPLKGGKYTYKLELDNTTLVQSLE